MGVSTRNDGTYELGGLRAGTYRVGFDSISGGYMPEFWDDAVTVETATDIVLGASSTATNRDARLAAGSHITGTVTGRTASASRA